jgi:putative sterol carrier protein
MAHTFPSKEWTDAYADAVNANEKYREHGKAWTFGSVAMVIEADAKRGLTEDTGMILDVAEGTCRGTAYVHGMDAVAEAPFIIVASYDQWKEVLRGDLDPIKGMMQNKLRLTKGHLPTMLRFVESSRQLVVSASNVPTAFLD